jgi:hypothetical protein
MYYRGGVRGIIELEVLRSIERAIGGRIPVQRFFDLIVGTRYAMNSPTSSTCADMDPSVPAVS